MLKNIAITTQENANHDEKRARPFRDRHLSAVAGQQPLQEKQR